MNAIIPVIAGGSAALLAYLFSKSGHEYWRTVVGVILGIVVGWGAGFILAILLNAGAEDAAVNALLRGMSYAFWCGLIGVIIGAIYGRKQIAKKLE